MIYCILDENGIIVNTIVCDDETAEAFNAKPYYEGCGIGDIYDPPPDPPTDSERIATLESDNKLLKQQIQATTEQNDFLEDCIAEMAAIVYE